MAPKKKAQPVHAAMAYPSGTWITKKQVMAILQVTSPKTIDEMINDGRLPAVKFNDKPGAAIRILVDDVYSMLVPVIPAEIMADLRSRMPSPLHLPVPAGGAAR